MARLSGTMPALLDKLRKEKLKKISLRKTLTIFDTYSHNPTFTKQLEELDEEIAELQRRIDGVHIRYK